MTKLEYNQFQAYIDGLYQDGEMSEQDYNDIILYILANGETEKTPRDLIQIRRGFQENLPNLAQGELGFTLDTEDLVIGGLNGNVSLKKTSNLLSLKDFNAVGDNITDDTLALKNALNKCIEEGKGLYIPEGKYLISEKITILDNTITNIIGEGAERSTLNFDVPNDYCFQIQSYYTRPLQIKSLSISAKEQATNRHGVSLKKSWGNGAIFENVNITNFGGNSLELNETFNSSFTNMEIRGYSIGSQRYGKLLKSDRQTSFGSNCTFRNVVFHVAKIGIQNLGASIYSFEGCTFENLDLFLNIEQLSGVSMYMDFNNNWFESVGKGIINSLMNEDTLEPIQPISKLANADRLLFSNSIQSGTPLTYHLNPITDPFRSKHFNIARGYVLTDRTNSRSKKFIKTLSSEALYVENVDMSEFNYSIHNAYRKGFFTVAVEVTNVDNNKMYAMYMSDGKNMFLQGEIKDPNNIGTTVKINYGWSDSLNMTFRAYGENLTKVETYITFIEYVI